MTDLLALVLPAMLGGLGLFLIVASLGVPRTALRRLQSTGAGPRLVGLAEGTILQAALTDASRRIRPEGGDLAERLQRSGWVYRSPAEYHARRMVLALAHMALGLGLSLALEALVAIRVAPLGPALLATAGAVHGFSTPDRALNRAIRRRRERLLREMGFGLDRISLFLQSGADIAEALAQTSEIGLFGQACGRLAASIGMGRSILEAIEAVSRDLPDTPQFDEFLQMVRISIQQGQSLVEPFKVRAAALRGALRLEIIREGNRARIKVVLITSLVVLSASLIVTIAPTLLLLAREGVV